MSFAGSFVLDKRENYDELATAIGASNDQIARGRNSRPTTEITVDGEKYTVKRIFPHQTTVNKFTLGVPAKLTLLEGKRAVATVTLQGSKLVMSNDNFSCVSEIVDGNLKEILTFNGKTMTRWSVKE
ncbi:fatty acid-binding protein 10-A, liver basic-like [Styela clava]